MIHPPLKKYHKGYYEWINAIIEKEDWIRWARESKPAPLPEYSKQELKSNKVSVFCLGREIKKYLLI